MTAKELISDGIVPLMTSDNVRDALSWMEEYRVMHLPIVNHRDFLGLISEFDLHDITDLDAPLGNMKLSIPTGFVYDDQHVFEVIRMFNELKLTVLPVIDENNAYLGSITLGGLLKTLGRIDAVNEPGGIVILRLNQNSFVLSEIAQIVESNDAKILALFVATIPDSTEIEVTLKANKQDLGPILQTFTRYNYNIKASFAQKDNVDDLMERYDSFMNFLNI